MASLNSSIWQVITNIQELGALSLSNTETLLNQTLTEEVEHSNEYFQMYKGRPVQLAGGTVITSIDLRLPKAPSGNPGLLSLNLEGSCINYSQVKQLFPTLVITSTPRGGSLEEATAHTSTSIWGKVIFGFREKRPDCVGYVTFRPLK